MECGREFEDKQVKMAFVNGAFSGLAGASLRCGHTHGALSQASPAQGLQGVRAAAPRRAAMGAMRRAGTWRMNAEGGNGENKEEEVQQPQTLKGIVIFVLTMGLFAVGLVATFSRTFLPSGLDMPVM